MAVAVASTTSSAWAGVANGGSIDLTPPSGLAVGDLIIAHIAGTSNVAATFGVSTADGGWVALGNLSAGAGGTAGMRVFYKIADADDLTNLNNEFRFSNNSGSGFMMAGGLYRITGYSGVPSIALDGDDTADSTPTFTNTITPSFADSLLLFLLTANDDQNSGSVAGYAITTSNPGTWTEAYDTYGDSTAFFGGGDGDALYSGAYANRPETTATGDSTCTLTTFANRSVGAIVVVTPVTNVTVSPAVITAVVAVQAPAITGGAVVSPAVITATASVQAPTVTTAAPDWVNTDKSSAPSWVNRDKS